MVLRTGGAPSVAWASRPHLQHRRLARDDGEVGAEEQRPAGLGVAARPVGDDEVHLPAEDRQGVQDVRSGGGQADGLHLRAPPRPIQSEDDDCAVRSQPG